MQIVCDPSSLIKLRKAQTLDILPQIFTAVYLPQAVQKECEERETEINQRIEAGIFVVQSVQNILPLGMGAGEREAISLAIELEISWILIDDERAIKKAKQNDLQIAQFFDVLLVAKARGLISTVQSCLELMISEGEGIENDLYAEILQQAGE